MNKASCEYVELIAPKTFAVAKERAVSKDNQLLRSPSQTSQMDFDQVESQVEEETETLQRPLLQLIAELTAEVKDLNQPGKLFLPVNFSILRFSSFILEGKKRLLIS